MSSTFIRKLGYGYKFREGGRQSKFSEYGVFPINRDTEPLGNLGSWGCKGRLVSVIFCIIQRVVRSHGKFSCGSIT